MLHKVDTRDCTLSINSVFRLLCSSIENLSLRYSIVPDIVPDMVVVGSLKMLKSHKMVIKSH